MRVGIDLRVLQIGHQYRGIGEHVRQLVHHFPSSPGFSGHRFVFLIFSGLEDPTAALVADLERYPRREVRRVGEFPNFDTHTVAGLVGRLGSDLRHVDERMVEGVALDVLLCVDFTLGVPRKPTCRTALIVYDLIPWLFRKDYLPTIRDNVAKRSGARRTLFDAYSAWRYHHRLRRAVAHADRLLPISDHTKRDFERLLGVPASKFRTIHLGTSPSSGNQVAGCELMGISAGGREVQVDLRQQRYLLYLGGADPRRRVVDLVQAFELLRARGFDRLRLLLAGFDFQRAGSIPQGQLRDMVLASEYRDDIVLCGFVSTPQRTVLLREAAVFVYPSRYEGFGLPILEAMSNECPVITYENSGIVESGGTAVLYAAGREEIAEHALRLLRDEALRRRVVLRGLEQAGKFRWSHTADMTLEALCSLHEPEQLGR